jgi:hypothetical protein
MQNLSVLQQQLTRTELFEAFRQQLIKDFERSGLPTQFTQNLAPDFHQLVAQVAQELRQCNQQSSTNLSRLLYNVDISEAQLKKYLQTSPEEDHWVVMAQLMVKRLLQKVVIRQYYKNKSGTTE